MKRLNTYLSARPCLDFGRGVPLEVFGNENPRYMIASVFFQNEDRTRLIGAKVARLTATTLGFTTAGYREVNLGA